MKATPKRSRSRNYDWKSNLSKKRWPYKDITDPKYIKDKQKLFLVFPELKGHNGWWWFKSNSLYKEYLQELMVDE